MIDTQVSRQLNNLIRQSTRLQYKIELAVDSLEDGPPGGKNTSERLQSLLEHREAWRSLQFTAKQVVNAYNGCRLFTGRHLVWTDVSRKMNVTQVPSAIRGIPDKTWTIKLNKVNINSVEDGVAMDPDQNLLVLVEETYRDALPFILFMYSSFLCPRIIFG